MLLSDPESCTDLTNATTESIHYHECLQNVRDIQLAEGSRRTWLSIFGGLFTFLVVFMGMIYCSRYNNQFNIYFNCFLFLFIN